MILCSLQLHLKNDNMYLLKGIYGCLSSCRLGRGSADVASRREARHSHQLGRALAGDAAAEPTAGLVDAVDQCQSFQVPLRCNLGTSGVGIVVTWVTGRAGNP